MTASRTLVPVDFSPASLSAARLAAQLAARHDGQVELLHVEPVAGGALLSVEPIVVPPTVWNNITGKARDEGVDRLHELESFLRAGAPNIDVTSRHISGSIVESILEAAEGAARIVLGSHGATGAQRLFFGSVAEAVSRRATCPVLVTRAGDEGESPPTFQRVVVAVARQDGARRLFDEALELVVPQGDVELVHVCAPVSFGPLDAALSGVSAEVQKLMETRREQAAHAMDNFSAEFGDRGVRVTSKIEEGRVEDVLLEAGEHADLMVVGSHARDGAVERVLGTTADRVLRHSRVPVLLVPPRS